MARHYVAALERYRESLCRAWLGTTLLRWGITGRAPAEHGSALRCGGVCLVARRHRQDCQLLLRFFIAGCSGGLHLGQVRVLHYQ